MNIIFYIMLIIVAVMVDRFNSQDKKRMFWVFLVILILGASFFSAQLGTIGSSDRVVYERWFFNGKNNELEIIRRIKAFNDPSYFLFSLILSKVVQSTKAFFFIITLVITTLNFLIINRYNKNKSYIYTLYFISLFFLNTTFLLRQSLALSFGSLAIMMFLEKKPIKSLLLVFVAFTFHKSSLILLIVPLVQYLQKRKIFINYAIIGLVVLIFVPTVIPVLVDKIPLLANFKQYEMTFMGGSLKSFFRGLPFYITLVMFVIHRELDDEEMFNRNALIIFSIGYLLTINFYWAWRITMVFNLFALFYIGQIMKAKNKNMSIMNFKLLIILLFVVITFRELILIYGI